MIVNRKLIVGQVASGCDDDDSFGCDALREDRYIHSASSDRLVRGTRTVFDDPDIFLGSSDGLHTAAADFLVLNWGIDC